MSDSSIQVKKPVNLIKLPSIAKQFNLGVIEFPFDRYFPIERINNGLNYIKEARDQNIESVIDIENFDKSYICNIIPHLCGAGISFFRVKMSNYFGGNRYKIPNFQSNIESFQKEIKSLIPIMKDYEVKLLIENHQDLSSDDILSIIKNTSEEWVGVNWDMGNSLAVGELPENFFDKIGPYLGNVHLKDYRVIPSQRGFGLLRCPLSSGAIDLGGLIKDLLKNDCLMPMSIELGAHQIRYCDVFLDEYWDAYSGRNEKKKNDFLEFINGIIEDDALDLDFYINQQSTEDIFEKEFLELRQSVDFLEALEV